MIVVADTSVLINLCRIGQAELLVPLYREVFIPPEVATEFRELAEHEPRFAGLAIPTLVRQRPTTRPWVAEPLHAGERAALSLALELRADAILVDERRAHAAARRLGLRTIGLLAVLLDAKSLGLLPQVTPLLTALREDAGFWMSDALYARVLRLASEVP